MPLDALAVRAGALIRKCIAFMDGGGDIRHVLSPDCLQTLTRNDQRVCPVRDLMKIDELFAERFREQGFRLPRRDLRELRIGTIERDDWGVIYSFDSDERGEFLEVYCCSGWGRGHDGDDGETLSISLVGINENDQEVFLIYP